MANCTAMWDFPGANAGDAIVSGTARKTQVLSLSATTRKTPKNKSRCGLVSRLWGKKMDSLLIGTIGVVVVLLIVFGLSGAVRLVQKLQYRMEFHDYMFEPLEPVMLPHRSVQHFEQHSPLIESFGFRRIGDFRLQPHPCPALARYFVSRDGTIFGGLDDHEGRRTYCFFSVLEDGTYLETGKSRPIVQSCNRMDRLCFVHVPEGSLEEIYHRHCKSLARLQKKHGLALVYEHDEFREVVSYGHRLIRWLAFRQGLAYAPPVCEQVKDFRAAMN